jgi:hypothetical protein
MLPFSVTFPATVPQGSEIPEGLINNSVYIYSIYMHIYVCVCVCVRACVRVARAPTFQMSILPQFLEQSLHNCDDKAAAPSKR